MLMKKIVAQKKNILSFIFERNAEAIATTTKINRRMPICGDKPPGLLISVPKPHGFVMREVS